jgi:hypothetical protein
LTRVAASHLRVGTFEYFAARGDTEGVRTLAEALLPILAQEAGSDEARSLRQTKHSAHLSRSTSRPARPGCAVSLASLQSKRGMKLWPKICCSAWPPTVPISR